MINSEKIKDIITRIIQNYHPDKIILFGSYARGNPTTCSDLDLLIIKDSLLPRYQRGTEVRKYLRGICFPVDLIIYTNDEIKKWKDTPLAFITTVIQHGKVLYEENLYERYREECLDRSETTLSRQ